MQVGQIRLVWAELCQIQLVKRVLREFAELIFYIAQMFIINYYLGMVVCVFLLVLAVTIFRVLIIRLIFLYDFLSLRHGTSSKVDAGAYDKLLRFLE